MINDFLSINFTLILFHICMTTRKYKKRHTWKSSLKRKRISKARLKRRKRRARSLRNRTPLKGGSILDFFYQLWAGLFSGSGGNDTVTNVSEAAVLGQPGQSGQSGQSEQSGQSGQSGQPGLPGAAPADFTRADDNIDLCQAKSLTACGRNDDLMSMLREVDRELKEAKNDANNEKYQGGLEVLVMVSDIFVKWLQENPRDRDQPESDIKSEKLYQDVRKALFNHDKASEAAVKDIMEFFKEKNKEIASSCMTKAAAYTFKKVGEECKAAFQATGVTEEQKAKIVAARLESLKDVYLTILCCLINHIVTDKNMADSGDGASANVGQQSAADSTSSAQRDSNSPSSSSGTNDGTTNNNSSPNQNDNSSPDQNDGSNTTPDDSSSTATSLVPRPTVIRQDSRALRANRRADSRQNAEQEKQKTDTSLNFVKGETPKKELELLGSIVKALYFTEDTYAQCCISAKIPDTIIDSRLSEDEKYIEYISLLQGASILEPLLDESKPMQEYIQKFTNLAASSDWSPSSPSTDKIALLLRSIIMQTSKTQDGLGSIKERVKKLLKDEDVLKSELVKSVLETTSRDLDKPDLPINEFVSPKSIPCFLVEWTQKHQQEDGDSCDWKEEMLAALGTTSTAADALRKLSEWYDTIKKAQEARKFAEVPEDYQIITNLFAYVGTLDALCGETVEDRAEAKAAAEQRFRKRVDTTSPDTGSSGWAATAAKKIEQETQERQALSDEIAQASQKMAKKIAQASQKREMEASQKREMEAARSDAMNRAAQRPSMGDQDLKAFRRELGKSRKNIQAKEKKRRIQKMKDELEHTGSTSPLFEDKDETEVKSMFEKALAARNYKKARAEAKAEAEKAAAKEETDRGEAEMDAEEKDDEAEEKDDEEEEKDDEAEEKEGRAKEPDMKAVEMVELTGKRNEEEEERRDEVENQAGGDPNPTPKARSAFAMGKEGTAAGVKWVAEVGKGAGDGIVGLGKYLGDGTASVTASGARSVGRRVKRAAKELSKLKAKQEERYPKKELQHICPYDKLVFRKFAMDQIANKVDDDKAKKTLNEQLETCTQLLTLCQSMPVEQDAKLLFTMFKLGSKDADVNADGTNKEPSSSVNKVPFAKDYEKACKALTNKIIEMNGGKVGVPLEEKQAIGAFFEKERGKVVPIGEVATAAVAMAAAATATVATAAVDIRDGETTSKDNKSEIGVVDTSKYVRQIAIFCSSGNFGFLKDETLKPIAENAMYCLDHAFEKSEFYKKLREEQQGEVPLTLPLKYDKNERVSKLWELVNQDGFVKRANASCGQINKNKVVWGQKCQDRWLDGRDDDLMGPDGTRSKNVCGIYDSKSKSEQLLQFLLFGKMVKGLMYFHNLLKIKAEKFGLTERAANLILNKGPATFPSEGILLTDASKDRLSSRGNAVGGNSTKDTERRCEARLKRQYVAQYYQLLINKVELILKREKVEKQEVAIVFGEEEIFDQTLPSFAPTAVVIKKTDGSYTFAGFVLWKMTSWTNEVGKLIKRYCPNEEGAFKKFETVLGRTLAPVVECKMYMNQEGQQTRWEAVQQGFQNKVGDVQGLFNEPTISPGGGRRRKSRRRRSRRSRHRGRRTRRRSASR